MIYTNESQQNKVCKLPILLNENEWKEACFCVNLCSLGDAATIVWNWEVDFLLFIIDPIYIVRSNVFNVLIKRWFKWVEFIILLFLVKVNLVDWLS